MDIKIKQTTETFDKCKTFVEFVNLLHNPLMLSRSAFTTVVSYNSREESTKCKHLKKYNKIINIRTKPLPLIHIFSRVHSYCGLL